LSLACDHFSGQASKPASLCHGDASRKKPITVTFDYCTTATVHTLVKADRYHPCIFGTLVLTLRCLYWCLVVLSLLPSAANAAVSYAADPDLPTLNPTSLERDFAGRLWLAEGSNLSWFDGHRFQLETPAESNATLSGAPYSPGAQLPWGSISGLEVVGDWLMVAHAKGAAAFDLIHWRWHAITFDGESASVSALTSHRGQVMLASGNSLFYLNLPSSKLVAAKHIARRVSGDWPARVSGLRSLPSGLYGTSDGGFWRYDLIQKRAEPLRFDLPDLDDGKRHAWSITEWPAGQLWLGYWNDGLVRLDLATQRAHWFHPARTNTGALRSTSIYDLMPLGERLIIASNRGLVYFQNDCDGSKHNGQNTQATQPENGCFRGLNLPRWDAVDGSGVVVDELESAEQADQHGLWASVLGEGLARFDYNDFYISNQVRVEQDSDQSAKGLRNNTVRAITSTPKALYVGTYGGGVQIARDRPFGQIWTMPNISYQSDRIEGRYLWHVNATLPDALILSTGDGVFSVQHNDSELTNNYPEQVSPIRRHGKQVSPIRRHGGQVTWQTSRQIDHQIKSARCSVKLKDTLFIGTVRGVYQIPVAQAQTPSAQNLIPIAGADGATFSCALVGDEAWFGSAKGLLRLNANAKLLPALSFATPSPKNAEPLRVFAQSHGAMHWLASNYGLIRAQRTLEGDWQLVQENSEIANAISIAVDHDACVWAGTSKGLVRFDPRTREKLRLDGADGLFGAEMNIGAVAFDGSYLHVGGNGGLSSLDPAKVRARVAKLLPRIERLRIDGGAWQRTQSLQLPARHAPVRIAFATNDYARPKQLRYALRWRAAGKAAPEWLELGAHADFLLERLPAGRHELEVRVQALDVPGSAVHQSLLKIDVAAMWFQRPGMWALGFVSLLALGFGIGQWRNRWLRQQRSTLRRQVGEQTQSLQQIATELQQRNAQLERLAVTDPLTGLANRRRLFEVLNQGTSNLAILAFDLDHFKRINDQFGHAAGDIVLVRFAEILQRVTPKKLAARVGGEEFVLVLDVGLVPSPEKVAEQLLAETSALRIDFPGAENLKFTVSIGVLESANGLAPDECLRRADRALYQAKQQRNALVVAE
jgi:diguanylate cyclase (GGDEF)-like protein